MRYRFGLALLALVLFVGIAQAQVTQTATLTTYSTSCLPSNCTMLTLPANAASATIQITGSFTATLQFQASPDNTTWTSITAYPLPSGSGASSATAAGLWQLSTSSVTYLRVRASAFTAGGLATVTLVSSTAPFTAPGSATVSGTVTVTPVDSGGGDVTDATNHAIKTEPYLAGVALSVAAPMPTTYSVPASNYAYLVSTGTTAGTLLAASTAGQSIVVDSVQITNADSTNGWIVHLCDGACSTANFLAFPVPKASASGDYSGVVSPLNFSTASNALLGIVCNGACSTNVTVSVTYHWLKR